MLKITRINDVYVKIEGEPHEEKELQQYLTFKVPGYRFMPAYRKGIWNGDKILYNRRTKALYAGLVPKVIEFANQAEYTIDNQLSDSTSGWSTTDTIEFIKQLGLPETIVPRDYQIDTITTTIQQRRITNISPTASGKSLMIYVIGRIVSGNILIIVPTTSLVEQMASDFAQYGYTQPVTKIYSGADKVVEHEFTISTWQSIYKMPVDWFNQFSTIICDEVHHAKATSITGVMEKATDVSNRIGFTGTLDGTQTHQYIIQGLFGAINHVTTTADLIEQKHLAELSIKIIQINYDQKTAAAARNFTYQQEIDFIIQHKQRNDLIAALALKLEGNTFVLFDRVEKHGKVLFDLIKNAVEKKQQKRNVYYISGEVSAQTREQIRNAVENENNAIIVASVKAFATGTNIVSLKNIIGAAPHKGRIRLLQSIGRVLRRSDSKTNAVFFDIVDNLSYKKHRNYTLRHFFERVNIYNEQQFPYTVHQIEFKHNEQ